MNDFLYLFSLILLSSFAYGGLRGAPWVPTWKKDMDVLKELARIEKGERVYDLGCGDGRVVAAMARNGANAFGYEISILPYVMARARVLLGGVNNCEIVFGDFWKKDVGDADLVFFFLLPKFYPRLKDKMERELKKGTRVIAYTWAMDGWELERAVVGVSGCKFYLYIMK